ncbi:AlbA family DNA-binding domain-containing protein [Rhodococcus qingshengii]|uniref:AlbA family DNA-binding domain-containing protein n=1 Tax=Rhodococcus qingshengii TaxID=334542 RepID=UPI0010A6AE1A|nr:ATP-binding protein [Rhodococcus qingshengii]THJ73966.1 ATP-binding protein [Rhodococcus qingshengii]
MDNVFGAVSKPVLTRGRVSVLSDGRYWTFNGRQRETDDYEQPVAHVDDLRDMPAADLKAAMRRYMVVFERNNPILHVVVEGDAEGDLEFRTLSEVSFAIANDELVMDLDIYSDRVPVAGETDTGAARRIAPPLSRNRMWLVSAYEDWDHDGRWWQTQIRLGFHTRCRTVEALVRDGLAIVALLNATAGQLDRANTLDLLRGGHAQALIGQPEGQWLETKREHYDLKKDTSQIKLARAVSQFANADLGGLVVIGLHTKKLAGIDAIHSVMPLAHNPSIRRRYVQILQNRIYPLPDNLRVEVIATSGGDLILIDIPSQPEELKPFLVHGAIVDGCVKDTFVSIIQRREDEGIPTSIASIHATLAAGRALIRHGKLLGPHND